jgi:hypothetical protein
MRTASLLTAGALALGSTFAFTGCDSASSGDGERATVRFERAGTSTMGKNEAAGELVITGSNGTLTITDLRFIVQHFKLEGDDDACERADHDDDECGEFESGPAFVNLPLGSGGVTVATGEVPAGTYSKLKFKVKDLNLDASDDDDDEEDDEAAERAALQRVAQEVRAAFPNWPRDASMVIVGTFQPTNGTARPFTAFFDAELKVERRLQPPVTVDGTTSLTVEIDPRLWLLTGSGTVLDLSALDYGRTGRVVDLRAKLKDGFSRVRYRRGD